MKLIGDGKYLNVSLPIEIKVQSFRHRHNLSGGQILRDPFQDSNRDAICSTYRELPPQQSDSIQHYDTVKHHHFVAQPLTTLKHDFMPAPVHAICSYSPRCGAIGSNLSLKQRLAKPSFGARLVPLLSSKNTIMNYDKTTSSSDDRRTPIRVNEGDQLSARSNVSIRAMNLKDRKRCIESGKKWKRHSLWKIESEKYSSVERGRKVNESLLKLCKHRVSSIHGFLAQKDIRELLKKTNYNRRELYVMYVRFKALCAMSPQTRGIDKHTFKRGVARLAVEDDFFVDRVFSLIDEDDSGVIEWNEFLTAMSALEKGSKEKKVQFFFNTYDLDGDGFLSRNDLSTMFLSSSMLQADRVTIDLVDALTTRIFRLLGAEDRDKLSIQDVIKYMANRDDEDVWDVFGRSMLKDFA